VLVSASDTVGEKDNKSIVAEYGDNGYYKVSRAVSTANTSEEGGEVKLVLNAILDKSENISLTDGVSINTGSCSLIVKSDIRVKSMSQLCGTYILKDGGAILLWDENKQDYKLFMFCSDEADKSCDSEIFGSHSLTIVSEPVADDPNAYNITLQSGEFMVNSTLNSGNPHVIPDNSRLTVEKNAVLNVLSNARIRTKGESVIEDRGTVIIGNVTLDRNKGTIMRGVLEECQGSVTLPYLYLGNYTFRGWYDGQTLYKAGSACTAPEAITLTAQWALGDSPDDYPGEEYFSDSYEAVKNIPVNVIQSEGGTISPESFLAARGETETFKVKAASGYVIKNVLLDGKSTPLDENGKLSLIDISESHSITALFAAIENTAYNDWVNPFVDIPRDFWCFDSIRYVVSAGLFSGTSADTFSPNNNMTREMVVAVLWRLSGGPVVPEDAEGFSDVPESSYAYEAIRWASYYGIVSGYGDGSFGYGDCVSREQLVTFLFRYAKNYAGEDVSLYDGTNLLGYTDMMQISRGMTQPFQWAIGAGIVSGTTDTALNPKGTATRAQVAAILSRYCNKFVLKEPVF